MRVVDTYVCACVSVCPIGRRSLLSSTVAGGRDPTDPEDVPFAGVERKTEEDHRPAEVVENFHEGVVEE